MSYFKVTKFTIQAYKQCPPIVTSTQQEIIFTYADFLVFSLLVTRTAQLYLTGAIRNLLTKECLFSHVFYCHLCQSLYLVTYNCFFSPVLITVLNCNIVLDDCYTLQLQRYKTFKSYMPIHIFMSYLHKLASGTTRMF